MWKYYIELFIDKYYGDLVEDAETLDGGLPLCNDFLVAKSFDNPEELNEWVSDNTTLNMKLMEYGIKGIYYPELKINDISK